MTSFHFLRWLQGLLQKKGRTRRAEPITRMALELLEDRLTPAIWDGVTNAGVLTANNNFNNAANWVGDVAPRPGEDLAFPAGVNPAKLAVVNTGGLRPNSVVISGSGYTFSGSALTIGSGATGSLIVNAAGSTNTINLPLNLGSTSSNQQFITVGGPGATLIINGVVSSVSGFSNPITKTGPGALELNANNTFTSSFNVAEGIVRIGAPRALGTTVATAADITDRNQVTFVQANAQLQVANNITVAEHVILSGMGIGNDGALLGYGGNNTWSGLVDMDSDASVGAYGNSTLTISGRIGDFGPGYDLYKFGFGEVVFDPVANAVKNPTGGNTYRGITTVDLGTLTIRHNLALGAANGTAFTRTVVNASPLGLGNGTLRLSPRTGNLTIVNELLELNGFGVQNGTVGALWSDGGNNVWTGGVVLGSPLPIGSNTSIGVNANTSLTIDGVVQNNGITYRGNPAKPIFAIDKLLPGKLIFTNANTYGGRTTVACGTLNIRDSSALGALPNGTVSGIAFFGDTVVMAGAALELEMDAINDRLATNVPTPNWNGVNNTVANWAADYAGKNNRSLFIRERLFLNGDGFAGANGALRNISGRNDWNGTINLNSTSAIGVGADLSGIYETPSANTAITAILNQLTISGVVSSTTTFNDEVQSLQLSTVLNDLAGTYTLTFAGATTAAIDLTMTTANVQSILEQLPTIGTGNVLVTGTQAVGVGGSFLITFQNLLAGTNVAQMTIDSTNLTGTTLTANLFTPTQGGVTPTYADLIKVLPGELVLAPGGLTSITSALPAVQAQAINTYTGNTTIQQGWITIKNNMSLGGRRSGLGDTAQSFTTVENGAALHLRPYFGQDLQVPEHLRLSGFGINRTFGNQTGLANNFLTKGALLSLRGNNTIGNSTFLADIHLIGSVGIGVEYIPATPANVSIYGIQGGTNLTIAAPSNSSLTFNATISESALNSGFTKLGSQRLTLNGDGYYGGNVTVQEGVLRISNDSALGLPDHAAGNTTVGGTTVVAGAALEFAPQRTSYTGGISSGAQIGAETLRIQSTGYLDNKGPGGNATLQGGGTIAPVTVLGEDHVWRGNIVLEAANVTIETPTNARIQIHGNVSGPGAIYKSGNGTLVLSGFNTYTGLTTVAQGILGVHSSAALGSPVNGTIVQNNATLEIQGEITVAGEALTVLGNGYATTGTIQADNRWFAQGPAPVPNGLTPGNLSTAGRINGIVVDPSDPDTMYVAASGGGAWKTKSGGITWEPLFDQVADNFANNQTLVMSMQIGSIAIDPTDPRILYVGTGQDHGAALRNGGVGVYRSTDSGKTWAPLNNTTPAPVTGIVTNPLVGGAVTKVIVDPLNPNTIYVSVSSQVVGGVASAGGVWRYTIGGDWFNLTAGATVAPTSAQYAAGADIATLPGTAIGGRYTDILLLNTPNPLFPTSFRTLYIGLGGVAENGVFWTDPDNPTGAVQPTWRANGLGAFPNFRTAAGNGVALNGNVSDVKLAGFVDAQGNARVWASMQATTGATSLVFTTAVPPTPTTPWVYAGTTWFNAATTPIPGAVTATTLLAPLNDYLGGNGDYSNAIVATSLTEFYVGGSNYLVRHAFGGVTNYTDITTASGVGPHVDPHTIAIRRPAAGSTSPVSIVWGNDGGVYDFVPSADTWTSVNGNLETSIVQSVAPAVSDFTSSLASTQANGIVQIAGSVPAGNHTWPGTLVNDGDNGKILRDPRDPNILYHVKNVAGIITVEMSTTGGALGSWTSLPAPALLELPSTLTPLVLDQQNTNRLITVNTVGLTTGLVELFLQNGTWNMYSLNASQNVRAVAISEYQGAYRDDASFLRAVAPDFGASAYDPDTIYFVNNNSRILNVSKNHGRTWVARNTLLAGAYGISDLVVDPRNRDFIYAVSDTPGNVPKVQFSRSAGLTNTWQNLTFNLNQFANLVVHKIVLDPRSPNALPLLSNPTTANYDGADIYIGTNVGVFKLTADTITGVRNLWQRVGEGLPQVGINDMVLNPALNTLTVATFGRGVFTIRLNPQDIQPGAIRVVSGTSVWTGPITLVGDTTLATQGSSGLADTKWSAQLTVLGAISGSANITKEGSGKLILAGPNTFAGNISIANGTIKTRHNSALGSTSNNLDIGASGALELENSISLGNITLRGNGFVQNSHYAGAIRNTANVNTLNANIILDGGTVRPPFTTADILNAIQVAPFDPADLARGIVFTGTPRVTIGVESGSQLTINGTISDRIGAGFTLAPSLVKELSGNLVFTQNNTYTGRTFVNGGSLEIRANQALGTAAAAGAFDTFVSEGAVLRLAGNITVAEALSLSGNANLTRDTALLNVSGNNTVTGNITVGNVVQAFSPTSPTLGATAQTGIDVALAGDTLRLTGVISGNTATTGIDANNNSVAVNAFGVRKLGLGELILSANNTYNGGTTVLSGILQITDTGTIGNTFLAGGTIAGSGNLGTLTGLAIPGNRIEPGASGGIGNLQPRNTVLNNNTTYNVRIDPTSNDRISVIGTINLANATLSVSATAAFNPFDSFTIVSSTGTRSGTFNAGATTITSTDGQLFDILYTANSVVLRRNRGTSQVGTITTVASSAPASPSNPGATVTFNVQVRANAVGNTTVGNAGTVTLFNNGVQIAGPTALNVAGNVVFNVPGLAVGSHSITARYNGNAAFITSTSAPFIHVVNGNLATVTITSTNLNALYGVPVIQATLTPPGALPTPTGNVTFTITQGTIVTTRVATLVAGVATLPGPLLDVGTYTITADYVGDSTFRPVLGPSLTQVVNQAPTSTTLVSFNPSGVGGTNITATVAAPGTPAIPDGSITFNVDGTDLPPVALVGGMATLTPPLSVGGPYAITATYTGNANFGASVSAGLSQPISADTTVTTLTTSPVGAGSFGQDVTFTATVTQTAGATAAGTVNFTYTINSVTAVVPVALSGGVASLTIPNPAVGTIIFSADYLGNSVAGASSSGMQAYFQNAASSTLTLTGPAFVFGSNNATFVASVTSPFTAATGNVTFFLDGVQQGLPVPLSAGSASFTAGNFTLGNRILTAEFDGLGNFANATQSAAFTVIDSPLAFTALPSTLASGASFAPQVQVLTPSGTVDTAFTGPVTLAVQSGPTGGTLRGTLTVNAVAGVANFSGLSFDLVGSYVLSAGAPGLGARVAPPIDVTINTILFTTSGSQPVSGSFAVTLRAVDVLGNTVTSFAGPVTITKLSGPGNLTGGVGATMTAGVASLTDLRVSQGGTYTFRITVNGFDIFFTYRTLGRLL